MAHQEHALNVRWSQFVLPYNHVLFHAFSLTEPYSNNVAEYNALLIGLQLVRKMGVQWKLMVIPRWLSV